MTQIDRFIEELAKHLKPHLNEAQVYRETTEIRTHLELDSREREQDGAAHADAEIAACRAFGSPRVIAEQLVRQARGYVSKSAWRLAWPCGIVLTLAFAVPYSLLGYWPWQESVDTAVRWAPFFALMFFGFRVMQTRRWLLGPMAVWAFLGSVGVVLGSNVIVSPKPSASAAQAMQVDMQRARDEVQGEQSLVDAWRAGKPSLTHAPALAESSSDSSIVIPFLPTPVTTSKGPGVSLVAAATPNNAVERWNRYGELYAKDVRQRLHNFEPEPVTASGVSPLWRSLALIAAFTAYQILVLACVNAGLLALARCLQRGRTRRDPLLV